MSNKNIIIGIIALVFASSFTTSCKSNKIVIDNKVKSRDQNTKALKIALNEVIKKDIKIDYTLLEEGENTAIFNRKQTEIKAKEALLKVKIAAQSEKTYVLAQAYLKEANEWFVISNKYDTQETSPHKEQIKKDNKDAQLYLEKKDKKSQNKIVDILKKTSEIVRFLGVFENNTYLQENVEINTNLP